MGVTIHLIDKGLDTGNILCQKILNFDNENETFKTLYNKLKNDMYLLFIENWDSIKNNKLIPIKQNEDIMTKHLLKDRPNLNIILPYGWNTRKIAKYLYDNDDKINFVINNRIKIIIQLIL